MSLAEGLEAKELREALEKTIVIFRHKGNDEPTTLDWANAIKAMDNALSRPKESYTQEAELMDSVVSMAKLFIEDDSSTAQDAFHMLDKAIEALDKFRAERNKK